MENRSGGRWESCYGRGQTGASRGEEWVTVENYRAVVEEPAGRRVVTKLVQTRPARRLGDARTRVLINGES